MTRPPTSILPQHNSTPSQPRRNRLSSIPSRDDGDDDDHHHDDADAPADTSLEAGNSLMPALFKRKAGRRWDHLRSAEPVIVPGHRAAATSESPWREFVESARYPHIPNEDSEVVDQEVMAKLQPSFGAHPPAHQLLHNGSAAAGTGSAVAKSRAAVSRRVRPLYERLWLLPLRHPLGPLACRLTVLSTSIIALALAARIFQQETAEDGPNPITPERTQVIVAIVVDVVAIPYIGYITVDDYTGKPLGLRPPKARIRLILMDLFFIIFKSASTALGFEAMFYFASDVTLPYLRALGAFELIGLISWAMTLTINVFREIERLGG